MLVLCAETVLIRIQYNRKTQAVFVHRIVFRATGESAELAMTDWLEDSAPGGDVGERTAFNYVGCCAYHVRGPEDIKILSGINLSMGKGTGRNVR